MLIGGDFAFGSSALRAVETSRQAGRPEQHVQGQERSHPSGHIVLLLKDKSSACMGKSREGQREGSLAQGGMILA